MEGNHREYLDHVGQDHRDILVTILAQGKLVWIQTPQEYLDDLDEVLLKVLTVAIDEVPERLKHVLLMLMARPESRSVELDELEELLSEAHSDLEKRLGGHKLQVQLRVGRPDQVEVL